MTAFPGAPVPTDPISILGRQSGRRSSSRRTGSRSKPKDRDFISGFMTGIDSFEGSDVQREQYFAQHAMFSQEVSNLDLKYKNLYHNVYGGDYNNFLLYEGQNLADDIARLHSAKAMLLNEQAIGKNTAENIKNSNAADPTRWNEPAVGLDGNPIYVRQQTLDENGQVIEVPIRIQNKGQYYEFLQNNSTFENPMIPGVLDVDEGVFRTAYEDLIKSKPADYYTTLADGKTKVINESVALQFSQEAFQTVMDGAETRPHGNGIYNTALEKIEDELSMLTPKGQLLTLKRMEANLNTIRVGYEHGKATGSTDPRYTKYTLAAADAMYSMYKNAYDKLDLQQNENYTTDTEGTYHQLQASNFEDWWINNNTALTLQYDFKERDLDANAYYDYRYNAMKEGDANDMAYYFPLEEIMPVTEVKEYAETFVHDNVSGNAVSQQELSNFLYTRHYSALEKSLPGMRKDGEEIIYNGTSYEFVDFNQDKAYLNGANQQTLEVPLYEVMPQILNQAPGDTYAGWVATAPGSEVGTTQMNVRIGTRQHMARPTLVGEATRDDYTHSMYENHTYYKGQATLPQLEQAYANYPTGQLPFNMLVADVSKFGYFQIDDNADPIFHSFVTGVVNRADMEDYDIGGIERPDQYSGNELFEGFKFKVSTSPNGVPYIEPIGERSRELLIRMDTKEEANLARALGKGIYYFYQTWIADDRWLPNAATKASTQLTEERIRQAQKDRQTNTFIEPPEVADQPIQFAPIDEVLKRNR